MKAEENELKKRLEIREAQIQSFEKAIEFWKDEEDMWIKAEANYQKRIEELEQSQSDEIEMFKKVIEFWKDEYQKRIEEIKQTQHENKNT